MVRSLDRIDWLPSEDSDASAITWAATSPVALATPPARAASSLPPSSPVSEASDTAPFDSGQRVDSSDPGVDRTSPVIGSKEEQKAILRRKAARKRRATIDLNNRTMAATRERLRREADERAERAKEDQHQTCVRLLQVMHDAGISLGTFLVFLFDPDTRVADLRKSRWDELFRDPSAINRILTSWTAGKDTPTRARELVTDWMVTYVAKLAGHESRRVTEDGWMRCPPEGLTKKDILAFDLSALYPKIEANAAVTLKVVSSFATSRRQAVSGSPKLHQRKRKVLTQVFASLLREHSQRNDYVAVYNGLYLYATGAQRQTISVLSHAGWSCSYPRLIDKTQPVNIDAQKENSATVTAAEPGQVLESSDRRKGVLPSLSASCMQDAQKLAATKKYKSAYDNVNFTDPIAEQSMGRKDAQQNMTNATAVPMHVDEDDFDLDDALDVDAAEAAFLAAPELDISDIMFTESEAKEWDDLLIHTAAEIVVDHGGPGFERFRKQLEATQPRDERQIRLHKTSIYPLQTMDIDEALVTGNIDVVDEIHVQLGVDLGSQESAGIARLFFGDQLTIARLRSIISARAGHERAGESWRWAKPVLAIFHTDMAAVSCVFLTHYGKSNAEEQDPGSLWFHNSVLDRKPIVSTSLPPYRVCRDLISVSLYARVLHCLLQVSGQPDLTSCAGSLSTWADLHSHARNIYRTYASTSLISELRRERAAGQPGDIVLENAALFLRDGLALRTFSRAVKSGRSGHIVLAFKWLALMFKAGGHPKYAREMLTLIHQLTHVWPPKLRELIMSNWLVNPTGHKDGWVALDLMQEHLNFWIKKIYAAHGSNASWEWLALISPCIDVLRSVANQMHSTMGSYQGSTHTTPDLTRDIRELMKSLDQRHIYTKMRERKDAGVALEPVTDLLTEGFRQLVYGANTALSEHNDEFRTLQARCRVKPLQPYVPLADEPGHGAVGDVQAVEQAAAAGPTVVEERAWHTPRAGTSVEEENMSDGGASTDSELDASAPTAAASSSEFGDYSHYDELYLRLVDEFDVELDPDSVWQEAEDSEEENDEI